MNKDLCLAGLLIACGCFVATGISAERPDPANEWTRQVEADWALQAALRDPSRKSGVRDGPPCPERDRELEARWAARHAALSDPLLDFDSILFVKRIPGLYSHMSDQNYGWWSRPGGGVCILEGIKTRAPRVHSLTGAMPPGSFSQPDLSHDATRILFGYAKHYPHVAGIANKVDKEKIPEDAFYHVFEIRSDGTGLQQLTSGHHDDFDAHYLADGDIVFLSTRRGTSVQCRPGDAKRSIKEALADSYVRCGGGAYRPVAVYTLHRMGPRGENIRPISPFENFEWTPSVASDGRILYARWDYVDRDNMPYMKLWSMQPDGTATQAVYGNLTLSPYSVFEARQVPGSQKIVFTASAHHSITGGSLVLLDPARGTEGPGPLERLTPEVCFPEVEGWPATYFASPYPLSERLYLTAWSTVPLVTEGKQNPPSALGIYLFDPKRGLELLHRDPEISSLLPIPLRPRVKPPAFPGGVVEATRREEASSDEGLVLLLDVYRGLDGVERGTVKNLRIVGVPPKTQPEMNSPMLGLTGDDPGKCVLGTVPVEEDGSAYFRAPSAMPVFFQALDARGLAVQTMRSATHVAQGRTLACVGCHEARTSAPPNGSSIAASRGPSAIQAGPDGSWPLRFDRLVQPVLERHCTGCHRPGVPGGAGEAAGGPGQPDAAAARIDLTAAESYRTLVSYGKPSLRDQVLAAYKLGRSIPLRGGAMDSRLLALLEGPGGHHEVQLDPDSFNRIVTWMDTYAQRLGSFSPAQEEELQELRERLAGRVVE